MSDNTFYLRILATFLTFIAILAFLHEGNLSEGYLSATKTFQARCEEDGFVVLNETLYYCSRAAEVPSVDLEWEE